MRRFDEDGEEREGRKSQSGDGDASLLNGDEERHPVHGEQQAA